MSLGVYIHFPYCRARCPYCDFAVHVVRDLPHEAYAQAILAELTLRAPAFARAGPLRSVFFGGGTPSLWKGDCVARVLNAVRVAFPGETPEISLEVNPDDLDVPGYAALRANGINRVSIGVQSFDDRVLKGLGRAHSGATAQRAIAAALAGGIDSVSIDLIFGGPNGDAGQTVEVARRDAERAVASGVHHISSYGLTLDELAVDVPLAKWVKTGRVRVPDADGQADLGRAMREVFASAGFVRYEISNYARGGAVSRHNLGYWNGEPYLGLGVGAYGALPDGRYGNTRAVSPYLAALGAGALPPGETDPLDRHARLAERVFLGLRLASGLDLAALGREFGEEAIAPLLAAVEGLRLSADGRALIAISGDGRLFLTERGLDLHSEIAARLI